MSDAWSEDVRCFDASNPNWQDTRDANCAFIKSREDYANDILRVKGRLFLNEVYRMLGIPESENGWIVGWKKGDVLSFEISIENDGHDIWIDFVEKVDPNKKN